MSLRERGKQRRAERALQAARRILVEEGVEGLQMRALADRAELSVRTLYNHFGSKAEVMTALGARALDELAAELAALAIDDGLALSRAIITVSIARFHADRELMRPLMAANYSGAAAEGGSLLIEQARGLQEVALEAAIEARQLTRDVPPRQLAHQILCSYNQAALSWAQGQIGHRAFETQALHAWACLLLGFARGPVRTTLLAELAALEPRMTSLVERHRRQGLASAG
ncbi:MAG: TetR/AcrR family transcriptional regulator [Proteobacteria bacterium]|nr:TetR/AcrR family transcriptional regulator [Pseudomonadota bacterium]